MLSRYLQSYTHILGLEWLGYRHHSPVSITWLSKAWYYLQSNRNVILRCQTRCWSRASIKLTVWQHMLHTSWNIHHIKISYREVVKTFKRTLMWGKNENEFVQEVMMYCARRGRQCSSGSKPEPSQEAGLLSCSSGGSWVPSFPTWCNLCWKCFIGSINNIDKEFIWDVYNIWILK